jgi:periplasmic protein TonB
MYNGADEPGTPSRTCLELMDLNRRSDPLLIGFLTLSLLLHLLVLYLVPRHALLPAAPVEEKPVVVEMRPPQPKERELEIPRTPDQTRTKPARRLGPSDRQVEKETAPRGRDFEDRTPRAPTPPPRPRQQTREQPAQPPKSAPQAERHPLQPESNAPPPQAAQTTPTQLPSIQDLLTLPKTTTDRMVAELRQKYRPEVAEGNAVWLDTEKDILNSFFRRFKAGIYRVWNYPPEAAARGEQGVCLLKITIRHDGTIADVQLKESSGSPTLDNEALAAVRRGGPYGELSRFYKENELNIFAFFSYNLVHTSKSIFGNN